jgi:GNAT superfamily N-acetyltransferase
LIRTAQRHELARLRDLLADANDAPYDIRVVAEEKCFGRGLAGEPIVRVFEEDGVLRGVAVRCGKYLRLLAVDRAHRRRGIGSALLRDADASVIAAEPGNYFTPGVVESDSGTVAFLSRHGYRESGRVWNLAAECGSELPQSGSGGKPPHSMLEMIEREFGAAWRFEAARGYAIYLEGIGFASYEANNRGLGTFGPTGVIHSMRGRGYGPPLVHGALAALRALGYQEAIIPWTEATAYYARVCGAKPAHRFLRFVKP